MAAATDTLSSAILDRIFEYASDSVCLLAGDGTIVYANPAALRILSPPLGALVGQVLSHLAGWTLASASAIELAIIRMGHSPHEPLRVETSVTAPQGVLTWEVSLTPLLNSKGHLTQILVETRDVTRHHALVERLQASEARLEEAQHLAQFGSWTWDIAHNQLEWSESLYRVFGIDPARKPLRIEDYLALIDPQEYERLLRSGQRAFHTKTAQAYDLHIIRPDGARRILYGIWAMETNTAGDVVRAYGSTQDVTDQRHTERMLTSMMERAHLLSDLTQRLTTSTNENAIYHEVAQTLIPLIGAHAVTLCLVEATGFIRKVYYVDDHLGAEEVLVQAGLEWDTWQSLTLRRLTDPFALTLGNTVLEAHSAAAIPIVLGSVVFGVLAVFHREPHHFTEAEIALLEATAHWTAITIHNARLRAWQQEATTHALHQRERMKHLTQRIITAQEAERTRIARDLHDEAAQSLVTILFGMTHLIKGVQGTPVEQALIDLRQMVKTTSEMVRNVAHNLRPAAFETTPLDLLLQTLCRRFARYTQIAVDYAGTMEVEVEPEVKVVLYRVVQEALTNVAKHAAATRVTVRLYDSHPYLILEVSDDGRGFVTEEAQGGIGLQGMGERIELLEGTLRVRSSPGQGTHVMARIPISDPGAGEGVGIGMRPP